MKKASCLLLFLYSCSLQAVETYWELGMGAINIDLPIYPGSSEENNYLIPFPYFRFKSEYFEVDDGVRGFIFDSPDIRLNISGDIAVPVDSDDSEIKTGMPDLDPVFQIGPSLEVIFSGGRRQPHELRFELPVRTAIATDIKSSHNIGWVAEPRITYETLRPFKSGWSFMTRGGLKFATEEFHQFYYDVPEQYANNLRPAYSSSSGYSGAFVDVSINWRQQDLILFSFARYQNLSNSAFEDSPLQQTTDYIAVGLGLVWVFSDSR